MALKQFLTVSMAAMMATAGPTGPASPSPPAGDGQPTAEACAALGFRGDVYEDHAYAPAMISPQSPPIPPPPVPSVERRIAQPAPPAAASSSVQEVVVTSSRHEGRLDAVPGQRSRVMAKPSYAAPGLPMETERYPNAVANPIRQVADAPVSTFSVDVDTASYANVRRFLNDGQRPPTDAVRVEELINYFDYGYDQPESRANPFRSYVAMAPAPWAAEHKLLHIGLQGYDLPRQELPPLNLVFLIDTSGSMSSEDRLPLAKQSLNLLIDQLRPQDRVAIVAYAGSAGAVLGPTDGRQKLKMRCALGALASGGSTAGGQGLALAYALAKQNFDPKAVNRVILMTDGDFNVGVADPAKLKDVVADRRKDGVYLSVFGFGRGNYNDTMMQALAQNGNGTAAYIDGLSEARKLFRVDFAKGLFPIADDVKIQVEFNPGQIREYRLIGYETRMLAREDFNNDQVDAGEVGSAASVTALYEVTPADARGSADPLRYGPDATAAPATGEIAYLKIRYKLPGERQSHLIERPITAADGYARLDQAPEATRWAAAVAGFGQTLRRDPRLPSGFGLNDVISLAETARGADPYGERAEFVQLVRAAGGAQGLSD
jgi:Ca-activated chloride channel family protein